MMDMRIIYIFLTVALLTGCLRTYKLDVQQGNVVTRDMVAQLAPGMSKPEVQALLGTPLLQDPFHQSRWDYYYVYRIRGGENIKDRQIVTLLFENERLDRIEGVAEFANQADAASLQVFSDPKSRKKKSRGILQRAWERLRRDRPRPQEEPAPQE